MKFKYFFKCLVLLWVIALGSSCATEKSERKLFAVLLIGPSDKIQVLIEEKYWTPRIGPEGFGGSGDNMYYWTTLTGEGPEYSNPLFHANAPKVGQFQHIGKIIVNRKKSLVTVKLERIISTPSEPLRTEPSPANGTYRIKRVSKERFITPE